MTPQRLSLALAVSLALNLFFGGFMVARWVIRGRHQPHEHFAQDNAQVRGARSKVMRALERQPPDQAELEATFGELRSATTAAQTKLHQHLIKIAPTLTPEQRTKLLKRWARRHRPGHHRGGPDHASEPQ